MFGYQIQQAIEQGYLSSTLEARRQPELRLDTTAASVPTEEMPQTLRRASIVGERAALAPQAAR